MRTVAVLGAGNMGTALAQTIAGNGQTARLTVRARIVIAATSDPASASDRQ